MTDRTERIDVMAEQIIAEHEATYHPGRECRENERAQCADRPSEHGDFAAMRDEMLRDPDVRAAYDDATDASTTCLNLIAAREHAGLTPRQVADRIAAGSGMSLRTARRWVDRYESGELMHNVPLWLLHTYGRAVGVRVQVNIETEASDA
jgi:hypothetical protein